MREEPEKKRAGETSETYEYLSFECYNCRSTTVRAPVVPQNVRTCAAMRNGIEKRMNPGNDFWYRTCEEWLVKMVVVSKLKDQCNSKHSMALD
jgi:hypothetical protein